MTSPVEKPCRVAPGATPVNVPRVFGAADGDRVRAGRLRAVAGDDPGDVRAVTARRVGVRHVPDVDELQWPEALAGGRVDQPGRRADDLEVPADPVREVGVVGVDARVDDRDADTVAGERLAVAVQVGAAGDGFLRDARAGGPHGRVAGVAQAPVLLEVLDGRLAGERADLADRADGEHRTSGRLEVGGDDEPVVGEQLAVLGGRPAGEVDEGAVRGRRGQAGEVGREAGARLDGAGGDQRLRCARARGHAGHEGGEGERGGDREREPDAPTALLARPLHYV